MVRRSLPGTTHRIRNGFDFTLSALPPSAVSCTYTVHMLYTYNPCADALSSYCRSTGGRRNPQQGRDEVPQERLRDLPGKSHVRQWSGRRTGIRNSRRKLKTVPLIYLALKTTSKRKLFVQPDQRVYALALCTGPLTSADRFGLLTDCKGPVSTMIGDVGIYGTSNPDRTRVP